MTIHPYRWPTSDDARSALGPIPHALGGLGVTIYGSGGVEGHASRAPRMNARKLKWPKRERPAPSNRTRLLNGTQAGTQAQPASTLIQRVSPNQKYALGLLGPVIGQPTYLRTSQTQRVSFHLFSLFGPQVLQNRLSDLSDLFQNNVPPVEQLNTGTGTWSFASYEKFFRRTT